MASHSNFFGAFFVLALVSVSNADGTFNLKAYGAVSGKGDSTKVSILVQN